MTTYQGLRIGDTDRDAAASALSEHYASGRLTKPEYDERLEAIWAATYDSDLRPVFADLPRLNSPRPNGDPDANRRRPSGRRMMMRGLPGHALDRVRFFWMAPLMLIGFLAVAVVALHLAPFLAFIALWFFICGGFKFRGRHHHWHSAR